MSAEFIHPGSARAWDSLMTWVTLSNGECPPFFPLEEGIFDLARPLNFRGEKGVAPKQKCRGVHAPIVALLRGKSVTHVIRSCPSRAAFGVLAKCSSNVGTTLQREDVSGEGAENNTRGACAPQT
jgi:hypothetical protein